MGAIYGLALLCASVVIFAYLVKAKRAVLPARWVGSKILVSAIMFTLLVGVVFGVAILAKFALTATIDEFGVFELIFFCAIIAATVMAWRGAKSPTLPDPA